MIILGETLGALRRSSKCGMDGYQSMAEAGNRYRLHTLSGGRF